ncbi:MAG: MBL fold metallo-hydrolase [Synergistaceae bacterium]|nr:MBL fold metallo-hydrolase [Synergistaceae bacterium]
MRIFCVKMPRVNAWLAESGGRWLLVDSGKPRTVGALFSGIASAGCNPRDISLLVISHAHFDHVGGAGRLKRESGVPIAIHRSEADLLRTGGFEISDGLNGLGRYRAFLGRHVAPRRMFAFEPAEPDVIIDAERRMDDFGFAATIIHSPGHSRGSVSLLTDDGDLFCGDLAITQPLPGIWSHMPIYGSSVQDIKRSWRALLDRGAKHIYPSHGRDFKAEELEDLLKCHGDD